MDAECNELRRYAKPTKYDPAPHGTIWNIIDEHDITTDIYIQVSEQEDMPNWITINDMLGKAFKLFIHNPVFVRECLQLYTIPIEQVPPIITTILKSTPTGR